MRYLAIGLVLAFWCVAAQAQLVGWISCEHTRVDEKLTGVSVALIERTRSADGRQYGDDPYTVPSMNAGIYIAVFDKATVATEIIGMRLTCKMDMPSPIDRHVIVHTQYWEQSIPIKAGGEPKLGVLIAETNGLKRVTIGKR